MNINEGDLVAITCEKKDAMIIGIYVKKCDDCHVIIINRVIQCFNFDDWTVQRFEN